MNAANFPLHMDELIEVYLAHGLSGKEKSDFEEHCAKCDPCKKSLEETKNFETSLFSALRQDRAPNDLEERTVNSFRNMKSKMKSERFEQGSFFMNLYKSRMFKIVGIAAAVLVVFVIGAMTSPEYKYASESAPLTMSMKSGAFDKEVAEDGYSLNRKLSIAPGSQNIREEKLRDSINNKSESWGGEMLGSDYNETPGDDSRNHEMKGDSKDFLSYLPGDGGGIRRGELRKEQNISGNEWERSKKGAPLSSVNKTADSKRANQVGEPLSPDRKIIKSGNLTFEVESFETAYQKIVAILNEEKGYIASSETTKLANGKIRGEIVIRVLPEKFDNITLKLRSLGELKNQQVTSEDISKQYVDLMARLKNSKALEERLIKLMAERKGEVKDFLEIEKELANVREKVEQIQGQLKYFDNMISLATIHLELMEKDMGTPVEYIQTQSANMAVAVSDVEKAYAQAQKFVTELKGGLIIESQLNNQNKRLNARVTAYVDAENFNLLLAQLKLLGEVKYAVEGQKQTPPDPSAESRVNVRVRKERGLVSLNLTPPTGEYIRTQEATIILESPDVEKAYGEVQSVATSSEAKILNATLNKEQNRTVAVVVCQVDANRFRSLVELIKSKAKVNKADLVERREGHGIDPKSALPAPTRDNPATIQITLQGPESVVEQVSPVWTTFRGSINALINSFSFFILGFAYVAPMAIGFILLVLIIKILFFRKKKAEVANPVETKQTEEVKK
jgi:hypothetical protein